jgi:hypothetical protein
MLENPSEPPSLKIRFLVVLGRLIDATVVQDMSVERLIDQFDGKNGLEWA